MEELRKICEGICPTVDFNSKELIDGGLIESLSLVKIISALEDKYDISIDMEYIQPKYFNSLDGIKGMIEEISGKPIN